MATIDKNSITATATGDPTVFQVGFDFTDDTAVNVTQGWLSVWKHAEFMYNTNMTNIERNAAMQEAMRVARKPDAETVIETALKKNLGVVVVRENPDMPEVYQKVEIAAVSSGVTLATKEVV